MPELSVVLMGQLGNILFQLSILYAYGKKLGIKPVLYSSYTNEHFNNKYKNHFVKNNLIFDFIEFREGLPEGSIIKIREEPGKPCNYVDYTDMINDYIYSASSRWNNIYMFEGWFQTSKYFNEYISDIKQFIIPPNMFNTNHQIINSYFLHIRGGDYLRYELHLLPFIDEYYDKCIEMLPLKHNTSIIILTNDMDYVKTFKSLERLTNVIYYEGNELESFDLMSKCIGGICANSTFSWWGSALNNYEFKDIMMPHKWFTDDNFKYQDIYYTPNGVKEVKIV